MTANPVADTTPRTAEEASRLPPTPRDGLDAAVQAVRAHCEAWTRTAPARRRELLAELRTTFPEVVQRWVEASLEAEGIPPANPAAGEEWVAGPYLVLRNLRLLEAALEDIEKHGSPRIPGPVTTRPGSQVIARVFPYDLYDRLFYPGVTAEVWMEPGVSADELAATQALAYRGGEGAGGGVCLVLGAGNVSSIGPMDLLYKLFVDNQVVVYKVHPVNDYLGPLMEEGFAPLVRDGLLRVVYGGAEEGAYLCRHPGVDEIHITGSDKTVEAIVFGPGEEGARRKAERRPLLEKPISSELGNVSPVIVVPGPWSAPDLEYQVENLVSTLTNNAGFNCNASRVLVTHDGWRLRPELLAGIRRTLGRVPTRRAYYPGAQDRWERFVAAHPEAEQYGDRRYGRLPWTFIPNLPAEAEDEVCYTTEAFCGVFAETPLAASDPAGFLRQAVDFVNERLWGTLNVTLVVHPASQKDPAVAAALDDAVARLRYGTVSLNHWAAVGYGLVVTPWGGFPGADLYDVQSGQGVVHNTLMFSRAQKAVVRAPHRAWPKPPWFYSHRTADGLGERLTRFEADPSPLKLPGIFRAALGG